MKSKLIQSSLSYQSAGVNIDAGNRFIEKIRPMAKSTHRREVITELGGFGGLFSLAQMHYQKPVLVSSTDGVGTKLKLAQEFKKHDSIGIDLVAMCVNDIIVCGAEPLFFLDYFATGKLEPEIGAQIVSGIASGCKEAGAALIGGETAEMPGIYQGQDYDLAGFAVGIVEQEKIVNGQTVQSGDILLALASSGLHSNGFSLVRKILSLSATSLSSSFAESTLGEVLLTPTKIYVKTILSLLQSHTIKAMAHITGGGLIENLPRVLPPYCQAQINIQTWQWPEIFHWLQQTGKVEYNEMQRTFNCGIGMVLVIDANQLTDIEKTLTELGETYFIIGQIASSKRVKPSIEWIK